MAITALAPERATVRIPVSGMTCAACQARVRRSLQKRPGCSTCR
jgi:copper chaperone CopZ